MADQLVDAETGEPLTDAEAQSVMAPQPAFVRTPREALRKAAELPTDAWRFVVRNAIPAGAMYGGAALGSAVGAGLAPETGGLSVAIPAALAAFGSGMGNVAATKGLPPELGGNPEQSATSAFLWGALPELAGTGLAKGVESRMLKRGAEGARQTLTDALRSGDVAAEDIGSVAGELNLPRLEAPAALSGGARTAKTFGYRDPVMEAIERRRAQLGEPIGKAYASLKGAEPIETADLADTAKAIRGNLRAPLSPKASTLLNRAEKLGPIINEQGEILVPADIEDAVRTGEMSPEMARSLSADRIAKPIALSKLASYRQLVNQAWRSATGADKYALGSLQGAIDQKLFPYLPAEIQAQRAEYKSFIDLFPYGDLNRVRRFATPGEVAQYAFGGQPERALEIIRAAKPEERGVLKEAFADHVLKGFNADLPPEQQLKAISKALDPYVQNGTIKELFGSPTNDTFRQILYAPLHRERWAKLLEQPKQAKAFDQAWIKTAKTASANELAEAEAGFKSVMDSLPEAERKWLLAQGAATPGATLPVLPTAQQAIEAGLTLSKPSSFLAYSKRRAEFALPYSAARMAMGGMGGIAYGGSVGAAFATIAATSAGYRALIENGGGTALAKFYASRSSREAAQNMLQMLAAIGAQTGQMR